MDGTELELTRTEFDLLHALADTIEVHMANLRRKLGDNRREPRWIKTVRGVGYRLVH